MRNIVLTIIVTAGLTIPFSFVGGSLYYRTDLKEQKICINDLQMRLDKTNRQLQDATETATRMGELWKNTQNALFSTKSMLDLYQKNTDYMPSNEEFQAQLKNP